ncbi:hypothetical protein D3C78_1407330 [compost metagenome]
MAVDRLDLRQRFYGDHCGDHLAGDAYPRATYGRNGFCAGHAGGNPGRFAVLYGDPAGDSAKHFAAVPQPRAAGVFHRYRSAEKAAGFAWSAGGDHQHFGVE